MQAGCWGRRDGSANLRVTPPILRTNYGMSRTKYAASCGVRLAIAGRPSSTSMSGQCKRLVSARCSGARGIGLPVRLQHIHATPAPPGGPWACGCDGMVAPWAPWLLLGTRIMPRQSTPPGATNTVIILIMTVRQAGTHQNNSHHLSLTD